MNIRIQQHTMMNRHAKLISRSEKDNAFTKMKYEKRKKKTTDYFIKL